MKIAILLLLLSASGAESSEVYKWTDEEGLTHYGEKPAGDAAVNVVMPKHHEPPKAQAHDEKHRLENIRKWTAARQEERENERIRKAELEEKKAKRTRRCNELKNNLADMQRRGRWYRLDEAGNRQYYSDEELEARIKEKAQVIKKNCR